MIMKSAIALVFVCVRACVRDHDRPKSVHFGSENQHVLIIQGNKSLTKPVIN